MSNSKHRHMPRSSETAMDLMRDEIEYHLDDFISILIHGIKSWVAAPFQSPQYPDAPDCAACHAIREMRGGKQPH